MKKVVICILTFFVAIITNGWALEVANNINKNLVNVEFNKQSVQDVSINFKLLEAKTIKVQYKKVLPIKGDLSIRSKYDLELVDVISTPEKDEYVVIAYDENKNIVDISSGELKVLSEKEGVVDSKITSLEQSDIKLLFEVILDKSGSMSYVIKDVVAIAQEFMSFYLPSGSKCRAVLFNTSYNVFPDDSQFCAQVSNQFNSVKAGGNTDIFSPLKNSYIYLNESKQKAKYQTAVLLITDGEDTVGLTEFEKLQTYKQKSTTFVYFLGNYKEEMLKKIGDYFVYNKDDFTEKLSKYLEQIGISYKMQRVISVDK